MRDHYTNLLFCCWSDCGFSDLTQNTYWRYWWSIFQNENVSSTKSSLLLIIWTEEIWRRWPHDRNILQDRSSANHRGSLPTPYWGLWPFLLTPRDRLVHHFQLWARRRAYRGGQPRLCVHRNTHGGVGAPCRLGIARTGMYTGGCRHRHIALSAAKLRRERFLASPCAQLTRQSLHAPLPVLRHCAQPDLETSSIPPSSLNSELPVSCSKWV